MPNPPKVYKNKAICHLKSLGWGFNSIQKAFEEKDKRNIIRSWKRDNKKYPLPVKNKENG